MENFDFVSFRHVELENGFWQKRYELNKAVSVKSVRDRFEDSGRFDALRFNFLKTGKRPHIFYDSDVAKWIEAVAYLMEHDRKAMHEHEALIDELVTCMAAAQREDGYLNSFHQQIEPQNIFQKRGNHELYCCGHLVEAAIAYEKATGKRTLLDVMERYLDCIEKAFITEKTAAFVTPGHEELELALYKLYRHTGNEKYRNMAEFFLTNRGKVIEDTVYADALKGCQDDVDIYHLREANGHSVRALYLYSGIADMALENGDKALKAALDSVWSDMTSGKMYITGGVGSTYRTESFTVPFDLPNHTAYAESCCAIAFILFALRMRRFKRDAKYGHLIERVLYNALLSSTSLDGRSFFYVNPLEIALEEYGRETAVPLKNRERLPKTARQEVFSCSCCPPNINRMLASLGDVICFDEEHAVIEQYISATVHSTFGDIRVAESYAISGKVTVSSKAYTADKITLRLPEWNRGHTAKMNRKPIYGTEKDGYITFEVPCDFTLEIDFAIAPRFVASNPCVRANAGRVALTYGPVVYCLEGVDNGPRLNRISVSPDAVRDAVLTPDFHGLLSIRLPGKRDCDCTQLYFDAQAANTSPVQLKFIPYFAFANRGESDMLVWVRRD